MRLVFTLIAFFTLSTLVAQNDTLYNRKDDQGLKQGFWKETINRNTEKGYYVNGLKDGIWTTYHPNGMVMDVMT